LRLQDQLNRGAPAPDGYSALAIVDTTSMTRVSLTPVCPTAHGEALSLDEETLYVTCTLSDQLAVIDIHDKMHPVVTARIAVGPAAGSPPNAIYGPYAVTRSPSDGTVWVSDNLSGDVRVYEPAKHAMNDARAVPVGGVAMVGAFSQDGTTLYVPHQGDDQLSRIDAASGQSQTVPFPASACKNAHAFVLAEGGQSGLVVCEGDHVTMPGTVVYLTTTPLVVTGFVPVGLYPDGAAWLPPQ
jgi:DNA-binding beta-propeller fold protein YncE